MECNFTYQKNEYTKAKSFCVDFYPASKKISDAIDYDEVRIPKSVNHLECGLYLNNNLVAFDNSYVVDHEEMASISMNLPDSFMFNAADVKAVLNVTKLDFTGSVNLDVVLGDDPGFNNLLIPDVNAVDGIKVDSASFDYYVEGKKAKKIKNIGFECIVTNSSSEQKLIYLCVSAKPNDRKTLLSSPSTLLFQNSFAEEISLLGPGKSTKLRVNIWDVSEKLEEFDLKLSSSEFSKLHIYPLIMIFGNQHKEVIHLENAKQIED